MRVKGPTLFSVYFGREEATAEAFDDEGWFRTGDTAVYEQGVYRILGRTSVDIIKCGGYKVRDERTSPWSSGCPVSQKRGLRFSTYTQLAETDRQLCRGYVVARCV